MKHLILILSCVFASLHSFAQQAGDLDSTFNNTGFTNDTCCYNNIEWSDVAIQADGKILVTSGKNFQFALIRYNPDGSKDNSFGINGSAVIPNTNTATCIAIQPDGKILVGGIEYPFTNYNYAVGRLNADGSIDSTFGVDGLWTQDFFNAFDDLWDMVLQPDGKILLSGTIGLPNSPIVVGIVRITADGVLDNSFSSDGIDTFRLSDYWSFGYGIELQSDGKIIVSGKDDPAASSVDSLFVMRLMQDGGLDPTFGNNGIATYNFGDYWTYGFDSEIQADGKIIVTGTVGMAVTLRDFLIVRFNTDGSLDNTFNGSGYRIIDMGQYEDAYESEIQSDGKIVIGGYTENSTFDSQFAWARVNTDGTIDSTFGMNGAKSFLLYTGKNQVTGMALQSDGKIVSVGQSDFAGTTITTRLIPNDFTQINEIDNYNFSVYPVPADDYLIVTFSKPLASSATIGLVDVLGREMKVQPMIKGESNITINFDRKLPEGFYTVRCISEHSTDAVKVLIRH